MEGVEFIEEYLSRIDAENAFDGSCRGSLELLEAREMTLLSSHIHSGKSFESFTVHKEIKE